MKRGRVDGHLSKEEYEASSSEIYPVGVAMLTNDNAIVIGLIYQSGCVHAIYASYGTIEIVVQE